MKNFLLLIFIFISLGLKGQTKTDIAVMEAAKNIKSGNYESALSLLKNANQTDYRVQYFQILATEKVYEIYGIEDFEEIHSLRIKLKNYLNLYRSKNENYSNDLMMILDRLNSAQPAQSYEEYLAIKEEQERQKRLKLKTQKLNELKNNFQDGNYNLILQEISSLRRDDLIDDYHLDYYQANSVYKLLENRTNLSFNDIENSRKIFRSYLTNYSSKDINYTNQIKDNLNILNTNYPATIDEFTAYKQDMERKRIEQELKDKMARIENAYEKANYYQLDLMLSEFPEGTKYQKDVLFYRTMYDYWEFNQKSYKSFNDISTIRHLVENRINNKELKNSKHYGELLRVSNILKNNYPKDIKAFKELEEKKRQATLARLKAEEKQRIEREKREEAQRRKAKRQRKFNRGYTALGFEGGTIAKYGLRFELNGYRDLGFFINARTNLMDLTELENTEEFVDNKNEAVLGMSVNLTKWFILNIGGGYGFYKFKNGQDHYASYKYVDSYYNENSYSNVLIDEEYYTGYGGVTVRLGNRFNLIGGVSIMNFMDDFQVDPEFTYGLTINLK
ncbi:hypothetical protein NLM59_07510 [Weeksellaceae bacterium KMM 9724]|uniref:hypothetical protein n=1 Tax=Profundicola chukchiensis TaxID=2961959 RepID=UPI00243FBAC3|nr:hypothetical protein [Profundicola chukchiensis]MDG4950768.1 hypothetical protein [Profundicola chukchiensis]